MTKKEQRQVQERVDSAVKNWVRFAVKNPALALAMVNARDMANEMQSTQFIHEVDGEYRIYSDRRYEHKLVAYGHPHGL